MPGSYLPGPDGAQCRTTLVARMVALQACRGPCGGRMPPPPDNAVASVLGGGILVWRAARHPTTRTRSSGDAGLSGWGTSGTLPAYRADARRHGCDLCAKRRHTKRCVCLRHGGGGQSTKEWRRARRSGGQRCHLSRWTATLPILPSSGKTWPKTFASLRYLRRARRPPSTARHRRDARLPSLTETTKFCGGQRSEC